MTVKIQFTGFVNEVKQMEWGTIYNMSHSQRQKNEQDEWETVGYDYFDVVGEIPTPQYSKGDQVEVQGNLKTRRYEGKDGVARVTLQVRAERMTRIQGQKRAEAAVQEVFGDIAPTTEAAWPEPKQAPVDQSQIPF